MSDEDEIFGPDGSAERAPDPRQEEAAAHLAKFFDEHRERVFFSRQLEVQNEDKWFHWVTNRALRELQARRIVSAETRHLRTGGEITLVWRRGYRYYRRRAKELVDLVDEYADPNIGGALGLHGESMVLEGFARNQFLMQGRHVREYGGRAWTETDHNLDFVFEKDSAGYGVEVKNTLGYMDYDELKVKLRVCERLGVAPVLAVRMLPRTWIREVIEEAGGFALILKYQLYPWSHRALAARVRNELGLPVDSPRALLQGTMERFLRWHQARV